MGYLVLLITEGQSTRISAHNLLNCRRGLFNQSMNHDPTIIVEASSRPVVIAAYLCLPVYGVCVCVFHILIIDGKIILYHKLLQMHLVPRLLNYIFKYVIYIDVHSLHL